MRLGRTAAISLAGLLPLGACGGTDQDSSQASASTVGTVEQSPVLDSPSPQGSLPSDPPATVPSAAAPVEAPVEAPEALRFTASLVGGGTLDLATLAGPPVLLWFWAPF